MLLALLVTAVAAVEWLPQEELMKKFPKRFPYQVRCPRPAPATPRPPPQKAKHFVGAGWQPCA